MNTHDTLRRLEIRARALPLALRCLARRPDGLEEAVERSDELLAELDVLLTQCVHGPRIGLAWMDDAERSIELKEMVYALMRPFMERMDASERVVLGFEMAARRDLQHSRARLRRARSRWPRGRVWPVERPVWGWA